MPIARYAVWDGARIGANDKPDLEFMPAILRRRLSPLARAALHVAHACAFDRGGVRFVYASRHGELDRTLELLQSIAADEALSPTTFGLSVLNASAGIYSIAKGDRQPATALAAGENTFGFGLLEAHARAHLDPGASVLYVYADAPAASPLGPVEGDVADVLAVGLLIEPTAERRLRCSYAPSSSPALAGHQAREFLQCLDGAGAASWSSQDRTWSWSWE